MVLKKESGATVHGAEERIMCSLFMALKQELCATVQGFD